MPEPKHTDSACSEVVQPSEQAVELESLLTMVLRGLFHPYPGDPLTELTQAQLRMMRALEAGAESASAVGENLGLSVSAVTQVANRLESLGLIQRTETLSDRRVKPLALTDRGRELLDLRNQVRVERADTAMRRISLEDQTAILQALTILRDAWISEDPSKAVPVISAEVSQQSTTTSSTEELTSMARRMIETHRPA